MTYRLAIFDFDGTVCATSTAIRHALLRTFEQRATWSPSVEDIETLVGRGLTLEETIRCLWRSHEPSASEDTRDIAEWVGTYREIYEREGERHACLFPGAETVFENLKRAEVPIVVVSNKGEAAVERALRQHRLRGFVALVVAASPAVKRKPDPMLYEHIVRPRYPGVAPHATLMVGDTETDIRFAHNCSIQSCWAAYGYGNREHCEKASPTHTIARLPDVLELFDVKTC